jgi:hypothetical protein
MLNVLATRRATNLYGPLSAEVRQRLDAVVSDPTNETWEDAHSIILNSKGFRTLWQAVIKADPTFPTTGPRTDSKGNQITPWARIPSRELLIEAINAAVPSHD